MHRFGEACADGTVEARFTTREEDPEVEVILDLDFLLHPSWPEIDHLVLRAAGAAGDPAERSVTVRLPADIRASYRFLRRRRTQGEAPGTGGLDELRALVETGMPDPDVAARIDDAFGSGTSASQLVGPAAAPGHPAWDAALPVPATPEAVELPLGDRTATLLRPPAQRAGRVPQRLVILLDGDVWLRSLGIAQAAARWHGWRAEALKPSGHHVPTAFLVLPTPDRERLADRAAMRELVIGRALPAAERELGGRISAHRVAVAGQSYGGLAAAGLAVDRGDRIGAAIVSSGSFWFTPERDARDDEAPGELTREVSVLARGGRRPLAGRRLLLHVGREEGTMIDQSEAFAAAAGNAGARVALDVWPGGHDYAWYRHALFSALDAW